MPSGRYDSIFSGTPGPRIHRVWDCRANISKLPSEYLKNFYYDTVNFNPRAIELAIAFAGTDHILAGSDYPHQIGSIPRMFESINGLNIPEPAKTAILGGNAARLLRL